MNRRGLLLGGSVVAVAAAAGGFALFRGSSANRPGGAFAVTLTDAEWADRLTDQEFAVLRKGSTETPYSSPLNDVTAPGTFACAGCDQPLYVTADKFDSGTGWPSFTRATPADNIGTRPDPRLLGLATEVFCARCGGHLGHVFDDGPEPTGLRHCINGVAMRFTPA